MNSRCHAGLNIYIVNLNSKSDVICKEQELCKADSCARLWNLWCCIILLLQGISGTPAPVLSSSLPVISQRQGHGKTTCTSNSTEGKRPLPSNDDNKEEVGYLGRRSCQLFVLVYILLGYIV